ncbi:MAG TPA: efflux RND transporter periplasmic adaptor subunit [Bryobacteraceae bacterium]|nr:efflux RND transporter periplasmic adaptor subunit [Bryobacteraceae bacterium]
MSSSVKKYLPAILASGFALPALVLTMSCAGNSQSASAPPPPEVGFSTVIQRSIPVYGTWVSTLQGYVTANIQPQVTGYLMRQEFREGSFVRKGQVLFQIDPRPFQAALAQTQGQLAQAQAQLGQAKAQLGLALINVKRDTPLAQAHAIAQSQLDNDIQTQKQNEALIAADEAAIQAAEANVRTAELNLGFTSVHSLVDGIVGITATQIGNLVSPTTILTTVSQVDPIKAYFSISEQEYLALAGRIPSASTIDILKGRDVPLQLTLANNEQYSRKGRILFADRQVNTQTGTIQIVGEFANPSNLLRPGQFGRVTAMTALNENALLVTQRAVTELQGNYQVALIGPDNHIKIKPVQVGVRTGDTWIIQRGVKPGDRVVSEGTSKVQDGEQVTPRSDTEKAVSPYQGHGEGN